MANRRTFVIVTLLIGACGRAEHRDKRHLCDALAITAASLKDSMLKQATAEYAATNRAMQKWERWSAKTVTLEQDGTGTYSGAWQRAQTYARAGSAFCDAARIAAWQLIELGRVINDPQVADALRPLGDGFTCAVSGPAESPNERTIFLGDWERQRAMAEAAAHDGVASCFKKFGGTPPLLHAPSIWVTLESAEK
jgi:hypothetical protein